MNLILESEIKFRKKIILKELTIRQGISVQNMFKHFSDCNQKQLIKLVRDTICLEI